METRTRTRDHGDDVLWIWETAIMILRIHAPQVARISSFFIETKPRCQNGPTTEEGKQ